MSAFDDIASKNGNKPFKKEPTQTQDKLKTNSRQTQDKLKTNSRQTQDKPKTNSRQTQDKLKTQPKTNLRQTQDKLKTQPKTKFRQNLRQKHSVYSLKGLAKDIMLFIFDICQKTGEKTTPPLTVKTIAESTNSNSKSIPKTIQRLIDQKGFLSRYNYEDGRGGFTQYSISSSIFTELRDMTETHAKPKTQPETNFYSSSSNIDNNKNTSTTNRYEIFKKIINEIDDDELKKVITDTEINNILNYRDQELNEDELKESLLDFIHDYNVVKADEKALGCNSNQLVGRFVSKMRIGHYISNKARQIRLEIQRKENEELERYLNEKRKLIKEINESKFEAWLLSDDSNEAKNSFSGFTNPDFKKERLRDYFFEKVFPYIKKHTL